MGYTMQGNKIVIWTNKVFVADKYPFHDEGENWTYFYKNLKDSKPFAQCLARLDDENKRHLIFEIINRTDFIFKSKKSHFKSRLNH